MNANLATHAASLCLPDFATRALDGQNQYSVAFSSVPFKIIGQAAEDQDLAFTNCVTVAVQEVGRKNLFLASSLPLLQYFPDSALPSIQALTI